MDALLIAYPQEETTEFCEFLGLCYLKSFAEKEGYKVEIIYLNSLEENEFKEIEWLIRKYTPKLLGMSILYPSHLLYFSYIITKIQQFDMKIHISVGGHGATFFKEYLLKNYKRLNSVMVGEGELSFLRLLKALSQNEDWTKSPNCAFLYNGKVMQNPTLPLINELDSLPFPWRNPKFIKDPAFVASIYSSRGCYGNCVFCSVRSFFDLAKGKKWRYRTPINVVNEVENLYKKGVRRFYFCDDNFIGPGRIGKARAKEIAKEILRRGLEIYFSIGARSNDIIDEELVWILRKAGLQVVFLGIESGVQRVLDRLNKKIRVEHNKKAIELLRKYGIRVDYGFILIDPYTTLEEIEENIRFVRDNNLHRGPSAVLLLNRLWPIPGTPIEKKLRKEGRLSPISDSKIVSNIFSQTSWVKHSIVKTFFYDYLPHEQIKKFAKCIELARGELMMRQDALFELRRLIESKTTEFNTSIFNNFINKINTWINNVGSLVLQILESSLYFQKYHTEVEEEWVIELIKKYDERALGKNFKDFVFEVKNALKS